MSCYYLDTYLKLNTGRGGLVDTKEVIDGLKSGHIGYFGMDVSEE